VMVKLSAASLQCHIRIHSEMLICCARNISYYQCWKSCAS